MLSSLCLKAQITKIDTNEKFYKIDYKNQLRSSKNSVFDSLTYIYRSSFYDLSGFPNASQ